MHRSRALIPPLLSLLCPFVGVGERLCRHPHRLFKKRDVPVEEIVTK